MENTTRTTTGKVRLSYVHLLKPYAHQQGQEEKYSAVVLVPKSDVTTKAKIDAAVQAAIQKGISEKWGGKTPALVHIPIHDGDGVRPGNGEPFGDECKGHWVFTASANLEYKPEVVDLNLDPIMDHSEVYSGMYARVSLNFFPYEFSGKKGIGISLGPVQKLADGEALGGSVVSAASAFGDSTPQAAPATGAINPITGMPM